MEARNYIKQIYIFNHISSKDIDSLSNLTSPTYLKKAHQVKHSILNNYNIWIIGFQ